MALPLPNPVPFIGSHFAAPGVGDGRDASPFGEIDPSVIGGVLGFVLVSAIASKVMGG